VLRIMLAVTALALFSAQRPRVYPAESGRTIIPAAAKQNLVAGVTRVRDLAAPLDEVLDVKRRIARGELQGETIYTSGPFLQHASCPGTERFRWGIRGVSAVLGNPLTSIDVLRGGQLVVPKGRRVR